MVGTTSPDITYSQLHALTAPFDQYSQHGPEVGWSILRSGMVEEGVEAIFDNKTTGEAGSEPYAFQVGEQPSAEQLDNITGELGDVLFYASEYSRYAQLSRADVWDRHATLGELQTAAEPLATPIVSPMDGELLPRSDVHATLGMAILRAVDVQNPRTPELWHGAAGRPPLATAVGDVFRAVGYMADAFGISTVDAVWHTVAKLEERTRRPAVIDAVQSAAPEVMSSQRRRLYVVPWIRRLTVIASTNQWSFEASSHPDRPPTRLAE